MDFDEIERLNAERTPGPWLYCMHATILVEESPVKYRVIASCSQKEMDAAESSGDYSEAIVREGVHNMQFIAALANNADELLRLARIGAQAEHVPT